MKKFLFLFCLAAIIFFTQNNRQAPNTDNTPQIYYTDRLLHRLIPVDFPQNGSSQRIADKMVQAILLGKDENEEILRIIPNIEKGIKVRVKGDTAYVNLSGELTERITKNPDTEQLAVYQIVNSLTSISGINRVCFTIDGKTQEDFLGFLNMREIFTPNYDI
ncbi:MAG: GerMN domain-containing protein [Clostridia bacterium]|nr:GerMN domain-containing protein [Clostridia bacterium]